MASLTCVACFVYIYVKNVFIFEKCHQISHVTLAKTSSFTIMAILYLVDHKSSWIFLLGRWFKWLSNRRKYGRSIQVVNHFPTWFELFPSYDDVMCIIELGYRLNGAKTNGLYCNLFWIWSTHLWKYWLKTEKKLKRLLLYMAEWTKNAD